MGLCRWISVAELGGMLTWEVRSCLRKSRYVLVLQRVFKMIGNCRG